MKLAHLAPMAFAVALTIQGSVMAEQSGHVTGVGGVFVKSKDPKALAQWYRDVLGLDAVRRARSSTQGLLDGLPGDR